MINNSQDNRLEQLKQWLDEHLQGKNWEIEVASADASFRRYFRVVENGKTMIAMDAPPDKEDIKPFIHVASAFKALNVNVPEIYVQDLEQGFMLIQDFGAGCYLDKLNEQTADALYADAMQALLRLQCSAKPKNEGFPPYDSTLLTNEMNLFRDWFLGRHLEIELDDAVNLLLDTTFVVLKDNALAQEQVWVHRDYHSRNLMIYDADNPGIIDFQDAVEGAITYDLASLLRDCYIAWPDEKVYAWVDKYLQELQARDFCTKVSPDEFKRWFDLMGMQRHLKAIGIFSRLNYRDSKPGYLNDIPRTLAYVENVCGKYPEFAEFSTYITDVVKPKLVVKETA